MRNDFELFSAIASGDDKSFNTLYAKYNNMVFNIAFRYCKSIDTAQDITQYIFLKLWESGSNIVAKGDMRNYLFTMTKNYTINYLRDEQTICTVEYNVEEHNDLFVSNDLYESNRITEMYDAFCEGLNLLNETKKQICLLKMKEYSNTDISEILDMPINTIKCYYTQSICFLKKYVSNKV